MRNRIQIAFAALIVALFYSGCGGNNDTFNPSLMASTSPAFTLTAAPGSRTVIAGQSTTFRLLSLRLRVSPARSHCP